MQQDYCNSQNNIYTWCITNNTTCNNARTSTTHESFACDGRSCSVQYQNR